MCPGSDVEMCKEKEGADCCLFSFQDLNETDSNGDGASHRDARDTSAALLHRYRRAAPTPPTDPPPGVTSAYFLSASSIADQSGAATAGSAPASTPEPFTSTVPAAASQFNPTLSTPAAPFTSALPASASRFSSALSLGPAFSLSPAPWLTDSAPTTPHTALELRTLTRPADPSPTGGDEAPLPSHGSSPAQPRLSTRAALTADVTASAGAHLASLQGASVGSGVPVPVRERAPPPPL